jgi:hypothetical protein
VCCCIASGDARVLQQQRSRVAAITPFVNEGILAPIEETPQYHKSQRKISR